MPRHLNYEPLSWTKISPGHILWLEKEVEDSEILRYGLAIGAKNHPCCVLAKPKVGYVSICTVCRCAPIVFRLYWLILAL